MDDLNKVSVKAAYASVVEDAEEGLLFIGFAEGEDADEPYVLFRQAFTGGPVWFEAGDEDLGAEDAVESLTLGPNSLSILISPLKAHKIGWLREVEVKIGPQTESAEDAIAALREMYGDRFRDAG